MLVAEADTASPQIVRKRVLLSEVGDSCRSVRGKIRRLIPDARLEIVWGMSCSSPSDRQTAVFIADFTAY
jgi:hypothetical protein